MADEHCACCAVNTAMKDSGLRDVGARLDVWRSAQKALAEARWPEDGGYDPQDILILARFLLGEDSMVGLVYTANSDDTAGGDEEDG